MATTESSNKWYFCQNEFDPDEQTLKDYVGFVYLITEIETDMKYVGKKLFHRKKTLPPLKGKTRKRRSLVESDWRTYYGSSENVKKALEERGENAYHREILHLCKTKGDCSYLEAKEQFERDVLLRDDYYNGIINCRINAKHLKLQEK